MSHKICQMGKIVFANRGEAKRWIGSALSRKNGPRVRANSMLPYPCRTCGGWHVTTRKQVRA